MPVPDDERLEAYLKQFRPLVPEPLPKAEPGLGTGRESVLATWAAAAVAILIVTGALTLSIRFERVPVKGTTGNVTPPESLVESMPLTVGRANVLLATAPSFKTVVDGMAFRAQTIPLPKGQCSAVAVLSKEKTKL